MSFTAKNEAGLKKIEEHLRNNHYLGGDQPSADDAKVFGEFKQPPSAEFPFTLGWFHELNQFADWVRASWGQAKGGDKKEDKKGKKEDKKGKKEEKKKEEKKPAAEEDDDDVDLFGDDDEEDEKAAAELAAKKKAEAEKKKQKAGPVMKSLIIWEVKVWEADQDLDALAKKILALELPGLVWKTEYKKAEVAYGIEKLQIGCVVEDEITSTDELQEMMEAFEDEVQSVDIASFNKL